MKRNSFPKAQHYVPRFILNNFCIGDTSQIYAFDKQNESVFKTNIKNVAVEKGFYNLEIDGITASIEPNLSQLESLAAGVLNKIIEDESLKNVSNDEKLLFSYFVVAQFTRVKQSRISLKQMNDTLVNRISEMGFDPNNVSGFKPSNDKDIKRISVIGLRENVIKLAPYIYDKAWILFRAPDTESYYISDNPVTLQNMIDYGPYGNLGLAVEGIEIYFPLSKKLSLGMLCRSYEKIIQSNYRKIQLLKKIGLLDKLGLAKSQLDSMQKIKHALDTGEAVQSRKENVINKNSLQVMYSTRFVFSSVDNFDLIREMFKDNIDFKNPPRMQIN